MKKEKREIKAIFFDIGGVLVKDRNFKKKNILFIKKFNLNESEFTKSIKKYIKLNQTHDYSEKEFPLNIAKDLKIKDKKKFVEMWLKEILEERYEVRKDVNKTLLKLKKKYLLGTLTNVTKYSDKQRNKLGLYKNFKIKLISHKERLRKPEMNFYKLMIQKTKLFPESILFIDDKKKFLFPAEKLGINTILFKNPQQLIKDLRKFGVKI